MITLVEAVILDFIYTSTLLSEQMGYHLIAKQENALVTKRSSDLVDP